jgi:DNA-binding GntR family transcriptional regulator
VSDYGLNRTNYERVRDLIRNDIASGIFPPGHRLKLTELEKRYGVSAAPIRDALQQLQGEGFIVFLPNRGASVRRIDRDFLWQIYEIRKAVETYFVRELADRITPTELDKLRSALNRHQRALTKANEGLVHDLDSEFHNLIISATKNIEAAAILGKHYTMIRPLRVRFGRSAERRQQLPQEHLAILSALEARDGDAASQLISQHIDLAFEDLAKMVLSTNHIS